MPAAPLPFRWDGEAMVLHPRFQRQADAAYTVGGVYRLAEVEERSEVSHRQEFAWLKEAWLSLPEHLADEFPSAEHLRKRALIATGWCSMTDYPCGSSAEALRWAANIRKEIDEYAIVKVERSVVRVFKARSQARNAMGKEDFQASKTAILEWIAKLLEVAPTTLARQTEAA